MLERRPVLPGRIVRMAAANAAVRARLERDQYFAAPALDPADAERAFARRAKRDAKRSVGEAAEDDTLQPQRLERFLEAHDDARRDVAIAMRHELRLQPLVGREARVYTGVHRVAARARREADDAEPRGRVGQQSTGRHAAILQAGVVVVDRAQGAQLVLKAQRLLIQGAR